MGLTTIVRSFKVPVAVLDRFFESNSVMPTFGYLLRTTAFSSRAMRASR